jgi:hypothetical protein
MGYAAGVSLLAELDAFYTERRACSLMSASTGPCGCDALLARLDEIEASVRALRLPLGYPDAHYHLRLHLDLVRAKERKLRLPGR